MRRSDLTIEDLFAPDMEGAVAVFRVEVVLSRQHAPTKLDRAPTLDGRRRFCN
jgi:hypothetical protein